MSKNFFYARVSTKEQNLDRQLEAIKHLDINERDIFSDKQTGKDFQRDGFLALRRCLRKDDVLYIKSIDRLGRNYKEIVSVWQTIIAEGIDIIVLDMPMLNTTLHKDLLGTFISDLILQVLSYVAEQERVNIHARQMEGIAVAKASGKKFGRPKAIVPDNFKQIYKKWKSGNMTAVQAYTTLGMKKATFYKIVKQYSKTPQ